jgi:RNA polymerase sigma-70 factor, ECF subfamily
MTFFAIARLTKETTHERQHKRDPFEEASVHGTRAAPETTARDEELLAAAARRDPAAVAALYERHMDPIYRFCLRRLGDRDAAEDATAQVFTKAISALPSFRGGSFQGWLFTIAHRVLLDSVRVNQAPLPLDAAEMVADPRPGPEEIAVSSDAARGIRALLERLPADQRQVVELRLAGLRGVEIAQVIGRSHGTVRNLQHEALQRLRDLHGLAPRSNQGG